MKYRLIDTHSHLDDEVLGRDLDIIIKHALEENIGMVTVGSDLESSRRAVAIANKYPEGVYAAIGLHPQKVSLDGTGTEGIEIGRFRELLAHPKVVAIGEIGLDYRDFPVLRRGDARTALVEGAKSRQKAVLSAFLELSREARLPLLLHCREAQEDLLGLLENWDKLTPGFDAHGIVHGFVGDWKTARRFFNLDFAISVTGIMAHGAYNTEAIRKAPASQLVIESDCPHSTVAPWAMRRSEPSYLPACVSAIAALRGEKTEALMASMTANSLRILKRLPR
jgi:TatD DNase family protein